MSKVYNTTSHEKISQCKIILHVYRYLWKYISLKKWHEGVV